MATLDELRVGDLVMYRAAYKVHTTSLENCICEVFEIENAYGMTDNVGIRPVRSLCPPNVVAEIYVFPANLVKIDLLP